MERAAVRRFLRNIAETDPEEISCTDCFDLVAGYVDLEVAGADADHSLAGLRQHLQQCGVCREEYELLRDFVRREDGKDR